MFGITKAINTLNLKFNNTELFWKSLCDDKAQFHHLNQGSMPNTGYLKKFHMSVDIIKNSGGSVGYSDYRSTLEKKESGAKNH